MKTGSFLAALQTLPNLFLASVAVTSILVMLSAY
jgi:hypothetical protein